MAQHSVDFSTPHRGSSNQGQGHLKLMKEARRQSSKIIKKYMMSRDIPDWFRGLSYFQNEAANKLNESLLYDSEQRSSHRVHAFLIKLGLTPMISNKQIKFLIKMSQANDLAFLWFLYELHYKTPEPEDYTINEQLILSAIAHLDMITTLRELDRLLPPGPKEETKPIIKPEKTKFLMPKRSSTDSKTNKNEKSPYLQPIILPKTMTHPNVCKRKTFRVNLAEYEDWENPNYVVHNESNRWFIDYEPTPGRRVVHNIIKEEIEKIFDEPELTRERANNPNVLCEAHRRLIDMESKLKTELQVIAREQCQKYFDVEGTRKERARERIKAQMEKDVEMFLEKFRTCAKKIHRCGPQKNKRDKKRSILVLKGGEDFHFEKLEDNGSTEQLSNDKDVANSTEHRVEGGVKRNCSDESENGENCEKRYSISCFHLGFCNRDDHNHNHNHDHNYNHSSNHNHNHKNEIINPNKRHICEVDDGDKLSTHSSHVFFVSAKEHEPFHFNYHKIFHIEHPYLDNNNDIKAQAAKAVNSEMSFQTKIECLGKPNIDKAISKCVKRTWQEAVEQYNQKNKQTFKEIENAQKAAGEVKIPLDFGRTTFDPKDTKFMEYMLKTAFEHMKKDCKFVLASLPEAHKLPSFFYFIENRYGLRYSEEDRQKLYQESMKILRALEKLTKKIPMPRIKQFCTNPFVSYSCRDYLVAKANHIKQEFYEQLDNAIMRQSRVFWFAMRPYLCTSGPPRNTYYAYMPSRSVDITRFRQWKSSEFMDAKGAWDSRQRELRNKVFK